MLNREGLKYLFQNKEVCLVGNSIKLFEKENGSIIDSHDTVCRFNKGISKLGHPSYGSRCDVLFHSHLKIVPIKYIEDTQFLSNTYLIHTGRLGRNNSNGIDNLYYVPLNSWTKIKSKLKLQKRQDPSTGIVAIDFVLSFDPKKIILFGFDWKKFPTFYDLNRKSEPHNYLAEKTFINKFIPNKIEIR